jgi:two-component system NtrC family sensor kinase
MASRGRRFRVYPGRFGQNSQLDGNGHHAHSRYCGVPAQFSCLDEHGIKTIDLHEGIETTLHILQHRLKENASRPEIQVQKDYGSLPPMAGNGGQLNQVIMNLLTNAIDALEEGNGDRPYAEIEAEPNMIRIQTWVMSS